MRRLCLLVVTTASSATSQTLDTRFLSVPVMSGVRRTVFGPIRTPAARPEPTARTLFFLIWPRGRNKIVSASLIYVYILL
jgi:hypothetical protein